MQVYVVGTAGSVHIRDRCPLFGVYFIERFHLYAYLYKYCIVHSALFNCRIIVQLMLLIIFVGLNVSCQVDSTTGQLSSSVQLHNIDKCSGRVGPTVPIRMSTSLNSSVTLFSDGRNESVGDISVQSLPCNDSNAQVYSVYVPFPHTTYTITAEILHALLPKSFILVTNSSKSYVDSIVLCINRCFC